MPQGQENTVISVRASFTGRPLGDGSNLVRIVSKLEAFNISERKYSKPISIFMVLYDIFYTYLSDCIFSN